MKRFVQLLLAALLLLGAISWSSPVLAWNPFGGVCTAGGAGSAVCQDPNPGTSNPITGANGTLVQIAGIISLVAGIAAVIVIIIAGLRYITSGGDAAKIQSAKHTLIFAIVGLVVIASAGLMITFVLGNI